MRRVHGMPFGAELLPYGGVRFRLWAPSAHTVALALESNGMWVDLPMTRDGAGWFVLNVQAAGAGSRYRFRIDDGLCVPDPASRSNPDGVHGASEVVDPAAFAWVDVDWHGRPWERTVIYELHVGCFSPAGTFAGVRERLRYLADLGVTALELMPVAAFAGTRNWGYDGVLPFAPAACYGPPEELKALVQAAHQQGLMVFLDVVYNHFGLEGNYLNVYAKPFFDTGHVTPWGPAIAFSGPDSRTVRDFFIHNALYWLEEFHFDGLRLDAVHAIHDDSEPDIIVELARAVRAGPGRRRRVHLMLENEKNVARYLRGEQGATPLYAAQWNDDFHHALHVLLTGEHSGYYGEFASTDDSAIRHLGRCLAEGFAWQGEPSPWRGGERRGEPSADLAPTAFISFLQNHDQVGNRPLGERIDVLASPAAVDAAVALRLLAPAPPLLFMGEEFGARQAFLYFCDLAPDLAAAVRQGREDEFARSAGEQGFAAPDELPDPGALATFHRCCLDWSALDAAPQRARLALYRQLLVLRRREIAPRLTDTRPLLTQWQVIGRHALTVCWTMRSGARLSLAANLGATPTDGVVRPPGRVLHAVPACAATALTQAWLPAWAVVWLLQDATAGTRGTRGGGPA